MGHGTDRRDTQMPCCHQGVWQEGIVNDDAWLVVKNFQNVGMDIGKNIEINYVLYM